MGIIPLIAFVILDSFLGIKAGLIAAIVFALIELIFSIVYFGELDLITFFSFLLVALLSYFSFKKNSATHFKMQPVVLSISFGLISLVLYFFDYPILLKFSIKYASQMPANFQTMFVREDVKLLLIKSSHYIGYAFLVHGAAILWAALKLSNWWWIVIRGVGFYLFMFVALMLARISL